MMKYSLDKVIDAMEQRQKTEDWDIRADALHYLREYQRYQNTPSRNGHMALVDYFDESQKSEPLSWDELRTMEGKPIWVKLFGSGFGEWDLCHAQLDDRIWFTDGNGLIFDLSEETLGKTWQAYRKERE